MKFINTASKQAKYKTNIFIYVYVNKKLKNMC